jgi:hypothetical protein
MHLPEIPSSRSIMTKASDPKGAPDLLKQKNLFQSTVNRLLRNSIELQKSMNEIQEQTAMQKKQLVILNKAVKDYVNSTAKISFHKRVNGE